MTAACVEPLPLYRPRDPQASDLWRLLDQHFETFQQVYDERFQAKYGFWRPVVERSVTAFLTLRRSARRASPASAAPTASTRCSWPFPASSAAPAPPATRNAPC